MANIMAVDAKLEEAEKQIADVKAVATHSKTSQDCRHGDSHKAYARVHQRLGQPEL